MEYRNLTSLQFRLSLFFFVVVVICITSKYDFAFNNFTYFWKKIPYDIYPNSYYFCCYFLIPEMPSFCYYFPPLWKTSFKVIFRKNLMAGSSLCFPSFGNIFILPLFLKNIFAAYGILCISSQHFKNVVPLPSDFSWENPVIQNVVFIYVICFFPLAAFNVFFHGL